MQGGGGAYVCVCVCVWWWGVGGEHMLVQSSFEKHF